MLRPRPLLYRSDFLEGTGTTACALALRWPLVHSAFGDCVARQRLGPSVSLLHSIACEKVAVLAVCRDCRHSVLRSKRINAGPIVDVGQRNKMEVAWRILAKFEIS